jgi:hypothetical protein
MHNKIKTLFRFAEKKVVGVNNPRSLSSYDHQVGRQKKRRLADSEMPEENYLFGSNIYSHAPLSEFYIIP